MQYNPEWSITSAVLIDILETLDHLKVVDRAKWRKPCLLLDGYWSRFALDFLKYVIDLLHEWFVCIGVPYGTALWQTGDSREKNGAYNIALAKGKEILYKKQTKMKTHTIELIDIIILANYAWAHLFSVQLAIRWQLSTEAEACSIEIYPSIKLSATPWQRQTKNECGNDIIIPNHNTPILTATITATFAANSTALITTFTTLATYKTPINTYYDPAYLTILDGEPCEVTNYSKGTTVVYLDSILQHTGIESAKEWIN